MQQGTSKLGAGAGTARRICTPVLTRSLSSPGNMRGVLVSPHAPMERAAPFRRRGSHGVESDSRQVLEIRAKRQQQQQESNGVGHLPTLSESNNGLPSPAAPPLLRPPLIPTLKIGMPATITAANLDDISLNRFQSTSFGNGNDTGRLASTVGGSISPPSDPGDTDDVTRDSGDIAGS